MQALGAYTLFNVYNYFQDSVHTHTHAHTHARTDHTHRVVYNGNWIEEQVFEKKGFKEDLKELIEVE